MNFACPVGACVVGPGKNFLGHAQMAPEGTVECLIKDRDALEHPSLLVRDPEWPDEIRLALGNDGISF